MAISHDMKSVYETRRANLRQLIANWGGPTSLAARLGHSNGSFIAQLAGPHPTRDISEKVARGIEDALQLERGWMDAKDHSTTQTPPLDDFLLAKAIQAVTLCAEDAKKKLSPATLAEIVGLVYEHAQERGGTCEEQFVQRLVRLAK